MQSIQQKPSAPRPEQGAPEPFNPSFYMFDKAMNTVKTAARIEDYARAFTKLYFSGKSLRGICPVHGGDNRSSFAVYPEKQNYYCFRCNEGGDVVNLCQRVEGHNTLWEAMLSLAQRFDVELPQRPESWGKWQKEKARIRDVAEDARKVVRRKRLFKVLVLTGPEFEIEDPDELRAAVGEAWEIFSSGMRRIGQ